MINVSKAFRQAVAENREYLLDVDIELRDGTQLDIGRMDPEDRDITGGGLSFDDAVSSDNNFDIGAAIINRCTLTLNNMYDDFSEYDFTDARVVPYVGLRLPDGTIERVRKGTFTVEDAKYNGSVITLTCLDNMARFDKPYSLSSLTYPATLGAIVRDACDRCGVELQTYSFPHSDHVVEERPSDEATTFREVISWAAQIACCFCRCDVYGRLELRWYDQEALEIPALDGGTMRPWTGGEAVDGGSFSPWTAGEVYDGGTFGDRDGLHHIYALFSMDIAVDDVVITGVRVVEKTGGEGGDTLVTYQSGTDGYVVSIEGNGLIQGGAGRQVADWIGERLIGFRFRRASASHLSDPTIEAGDVGYLSDRKGNTYRIVVSSTKFKAGAAQSTSSSAQTPARNSATRFSADTKNYVENRKHIEKEQTDREKALADLKERIDESPGLFTTREILADGGSVFYLHDKPLLEDSKIIWIMTTDAWGVSTDGGKTLNAGMTVDGDLIARILTVIGVRGEWFKAGALSVQDKKGKETFYADADTGAVRIVAESFSLTSGKTIESIADEKADAVRTELSSSITQTASGIRSEVSRTYSTKSETTSAVNGAVSSAVSSANAATDEKLKGYPTAVAMQSAIDQKAGEISLSVSRTYETKTDAGSKYSTLESKISVVDGKITSKVSRDDVSSMITQSADAIRLKAGRIAWSSSGSSMTESGRLTCTSGSIGGFAISTSQIVGSNASDRDQIVALQIPSSDMNWAFAIGRRTGTGDGQIWDPETGQWIWPSYTYSSCAFRVSKAGALVATSASIKGKIIADDVILKSISVKANNAEKYFRGATRDLDIDGVTHHFVHGIYTGTSSTGSPNAPFEID